MMLPEAALTLRRAPELPGKSPQASRLHGIGRNDLVLHVVALRTFEPAILKGHGTMDDAREHHSGRAARTTRALDGCEGWAGGNLWHDASLRLGGSVQHSQSPMKAGYGAVIGHSHMSGTGHVVNIAHVGKVNEAE
jgi:hypothetical protein